GLTRVSFQSERPPDRRLTCHSASCVHFETVKLTHRTPSRRFGRRLFVLVASVSVAFALPSMADVKEHPGAAIYRKLCAECHGDKGQGVQDKYDEPLHGNRSVESL